MEPSKPVKNIAQIAFGESEWSSKSNTEWDPTETILLKTIPFYEINVEMVVSSEESKDDWDLLLEEVKKLLSSKEDIDTAFISFWAKRIDSTSSVNHFFTINEESLECVKKVLSSHIFKIDGYASVYSTKDNRMMNTVQFAYNSDKMSLKGGVGELISKRNTCYIYHAMRKRDPKGTMSVAFNWTVSLEWAQAFIPPLKLEQNTFLTKLFNSGDSTMDMTIVVGNGSEVKCHKAIFAGHSDVLAAMISNNTRMKEAETGRVELLELSENGANILLPYFYGMELFMNDLDSDVAVELFEFAHKYNIPELESALGKMFLVRGAEWFSGDTILELYFFVSKLDGNEDLKDHSLKLLTEMSSEVKACERYQNLEDEKALNLLWNMLNRVV